MSEELLLTMKQAAEIAEVLPQAIYRATAQGRLPYVERFGKKLIRPDDLWEYTRTAGQRNGARAKAGLQAPRHRRRAG